MLGGGEDGIVDRSMDDEGSRAWSLVSDQNGSTVSGEKNFKSSPGWYMRSKDCLEIST